MSEKRDRVQLNMDELEKVVGGQLTVRVLDDGSAVVERINSSYQVIQTVDILGDPEEVFAEIQDVYWGFEQGKRDAETLKYLYKKGLISTPR